MNQMIDLYDGWGFGERRGCTDLNRTVGIETPC